MKITIEPTSKIVQLETAHGVVPARIWEGTSDNGTPVHCFVTRICPSIPQPLPPEVEQEFSKALEETNAPSHAIRAIPLRFIL
jgi:hypothetical protein